MSHYVTRGQLNPPVEVRPLYPSGKVVPLDGVTTVRMVIELDGNTLVDVTSPDPSLTWDLATCIIAYQWQSGDTDVKGDLTIVVYLDGVRYPSIGSEDGAIV